MIQIKIENVNRNPNGYAEITALMRFTLPTAYGTTTAPIAGLSAIIASHVNDGFTLEVTSDTPAKHYVLVRKTISVANNAVLALVKTQLLTQYAAIRTKLDSLTVSPYDQLAGLTYDGTSWS